MAKDKDGEPGTKPVDAPTARRRQDAIGRRLRQMYEEVVSEPVPDDFMSFLHQADKAKEPSGSKGGASSSNQ
jgi:hypothetical protein